MQFEWNKQNYNILIWNMEYLGDLVSIDTETTLSPFTTTPDLVTFQAFSGGENVYYVRREDVYAFINKHSESTLLAHNFAFDFDVIHKATESRILYDHYDNNRAIDTGILYRLLQLAVTGQTPFRYNLKMLTKKFLNVEMEKDERRENFGQFLNMGIDKIPQEFLEYGSIDVIATFQLYHKLIEYIEPHDRYNTLLSHNIQIKGEVALNHIHKNGFGFDLAQRDKWLIGKDKELKEVALRLSDWGLIRGVSGYKGQFKFIVEEMLKLKVQYRYKKLKCRKTEKGLWIYDESGMAEINKRMIKIQEGQVCHAEPSISTQKEDLEEFESHSFISDFLKFQQTEKEISFVSNIESSRVHGRFTSILNTGRVSMSKPNLMQIPRDGDIRSMFKADKGKEFYIIDYSGMENAMLAQVLMSKYGESVMADAINEGKDLHRYYASILFSKPEDKVTKIERQQAKAAVFGLPGGLGIKTFIQFSRGYGLKLTQSEAQNMKDKYFEAFPEMRDYLRDNEEGTVFTLTGRKRGKASYCAAANTPFQGLGSDMAKIALYELDKKGYKIVNFIHDEVIIEQDKNVDRYQEACDIMVKAGDIAPDLLIGVDGGRSDRWVKM